jgi:hypothetical protein
MKYVQESKAHEMFNESLNERYEKCKVANLEFDPSDVLESCDPTAYRCYFNDWCDSEGITTSPDESDEEVPFEDLSFEDQCAEIRKCKNCSVAESCPEHVAK